jgi:hypothetical protein
MIEAGELWRYHTVRLVKDGKPVRILAGDVRYAVTGPGLWDYRPDPEGDHFLAKSRVWSHPWGWPLRLDEVEPLPGSEGLYHPDHIASVMELQLSMSYPGSWRQYADRLAEAA